MLRGTIQVFSRTFSNSHAGSVVSDSQANLYFMPAQRAMEFEEEFDKLQEAYSSGMGCIRGLRSAFAIEAVTAMACFAVWYGWHLIR